MPALHHLALRTRDVTALAEFYQRWLGLSRVRQNERGIWLALGSGVLMIELAEPAEPAIAPGSRELLAVAASVSERAALRAQLHEARMLEGETEHTLYFRDPDGRRVGVSSFPLADAFDRED